MLIKRGKVTGIKNSIQVNGHSENGQAGTFQVVLLKLDGSAVRIKSRNIPLIDIGDELVVAGKLKNGVVKSFAYKNLSNGSYNDNGGVGISILTGILAITAGFTSLISIHTWLASIPFLAFTIAGGLIVRHGLNLMKAKRKLKRMQNSNIF
ncbi:hypothetical protein L4C34_19460 [Vibrio profundum]|uniref:hypothetical protein n=1 Tax=Vibrio profundum TaxID=2910247 RepID=UPI003D0FB941